MQKFILSSFGQKNLYHSLIFLIGLELGLPVTLFPHTVRFFADFTQSAQQESRLMHSQAWPKCIFGKAVPYRTTLLQIERESETKGEKSEI